MLNYRRLDYRKSSLSVLLLASVSFLTAASALAEPPKLRVGVAGAPPFNLSDRYPPEGISVNIWKAMTESQDLEYELIPQTGVQSGLEALIQGKLDVLIGPVSITAERLEQVQFTQPYYTTRIGILVSSQSPTLWSTLRPFFRLAVISSIAVLILALFIVGNLLWLAERRRNPEHFPKSYLEGVGNGMWFALVTLTTVGYGDKAPVTITGRMITAVWMVITMVTASSLTAGLATAFTLSLSTQTREIFEQPAHLKDRTVAVVTGTTGAEWASYYQARLIETPNLQRAVEVLLAGQAQGVIFDVPALQYYLHQNPKVKLKVADLTLATENYGFALSLDSDLVHDLNVEIVKMQESGEIEGIVNQGIR